MKKEMSFKEAMNNKEFQKEKEDIIINKNIPFSFTNDDYTIIEGKPKYTDSERNKRSGAATAIISNNTLALITSKNIDYPDPKNWNNDIATVGFYNKSHIIAYSLSAKQCDPNNIFIGTTFLNQITMKSVEKEIYQNIKTNHRTYLYKVTPIYKSISSIIPFGVLIEAKTVDKKEQHTICRFCYNIQEGENIDYYKSITTNMVKANDDKDESNNKFQHYAINIRTKTCHLLYKNCNYLKNVESKYIQETKTSKEVLRDKKFALCQKCINSNKNRKD